METWKDIPGFEKFYQASTFGNIRSVDRLVKQHHGSLQLKKGKLLSVAIDKTGYKFCALSKENKLITYRVHRLIAITFLLKKNICKKEINHIDGNKLNNNIENLEWCDRRENINHAIKNGLLKYKRGENSCNSKLTNNQYRNILELRKLGLKLFEIAKIYNIHFGTVSKIIKRYDKNPL